jgi:hypothetical protein
MPVLQTHLPGARDACRMAAARAGGRPAGCRGEWKPRVVQSARRWGSARHRPCGDQRCRRQRAAAPLGQKRWAMCECARRGCPSRIELTRAHCEVLRSRPRRFVVVPGHEEPQIVDVVEVYPGYLLVEKQGAAARMRKPPTRASQRRPARAAPDRATRARRCRINRPERVGAALRCISRQLLTNLAIESRFSRNLRRKGVRTSRLGKDV